MIVSLDKSTQVDDQDSDLIMKLHKSSRTENSEFENNDIVVHEYDSEIAFKVHDVEEVKKVSDKITETEENKERQNKNTVEDEP